MVRKRVENWIDAEQIPCVRQKICSPHIYIPPVVAHDLADETEISQVPSGKGQRSRKIRTPLILVQVVEIRRRGSRWQPLDRTADVGR
eukprot:scaffold2600_cov73-Cyclotella_meneghiniana.AAC.14